MDSALFDGILHPDDAAIVASHHACMASVCDGEVRALTYRMRHSNGEWRWLNSRDVLFSLDEQGVVRQILGFAEDVTVRKQAEESLREINERFSIAFNNAPIMISISNLDDGKYLDVNQKYLDVSGFSREEVIGKNSIELGWISESDREELKYNILRYSKIHDHLLNLKTKSGQTVICKYWGDIINVAGEKRLLSVALDITEHHLIEQQLLQAQKMESVGRLAGGVAHDFNNLLTVILGCTHLSLSETEPTHPLYEYLKSIQTAANKSADLTQQLLAFARKQAIEPKVLDLNDTVSGMLKMLQRLIGENTQLTWQPANNLWPVKADPSQIDQILANLCVNARDSINDIGTITIQTGNSVVDEGYGAEHAEVIPGEYVNISVRDNGCGMDKETMAHIFEPFFTTKGIGEGTGLGLATVYGAAKQNNGFVNVYSEPGIGTTFTIYLPRYVGSTDQTSTKGQTQPAPRGLDTILLVEDEPAILNMVTMLLQKQGYTVLAANTPGEATSLASEHSGKIDLLITDVIMPGMNGKDLAHNLMSLNPKLKCLFMSGYTADAISHHGVLEEGMNFIHKPFSLPDLAVKVRKVLDNN